MVPPLPKFTTDEEEKLISLVQERPVIYDKGDKEYKNRTVQQNQWMDISQVLVGRSAEDCKRVWKSLRNQFLAFLKRLENPSGTGRQGRPYFRHEQPMMFLKDRFEDTERTASNLGTEEEEQEAFGVDVNDSMQIENEDNLPNPPEEIAASGSASKDVAVLVSRAKTGSSKKRKMDPFDQQMMSLVKQDEDEFELFCRSMVPKLRRIADKDRKEYLRLTNTIMSKITDAELELLD